MASQHLPPSASPAIQPLEYAQPLTEPLPHSELGSLSLAFTGIWLGCLGITVATMAVDWRATTHPITLVFATLTLMAMAIFVPMGFLVAVLGLMEQHCCRTCAYVCASVNGAVLTVVVFAVSGRF
jgi:hypothetical protein